jgi:hypothetical protein
VGLSKAGSRFAWSKTYFAAKARARAAAGYPADVGGLWTDQQAEKDLCPRRTQKAAADSCPLLRQSSIRNTGLKETTC